MVVCGAGHVALALSKVAVGIGFKVTVIDPRAEFANQERFGKDVHVICDDFGPALAQFKNEYIWYAVMTRGHKDDELCAEAALKGKYMYCGMIGSKSKVAYAKDLLAKAGCTQEQLDSLHAPIGLSIGAQTPEEIAISICAQLVQERAALGCSYLDNQVYEALLHEQGGMTVATIIEKKGSAPRGVGSCLAVVDEKSTIYGTVGGGSVEAAVIEQAKAMHEGDAPFIKTYDLSNSAAATLGMVCGGAVTVLFERT